MASNPRYARGVIQEIIKRHGALPKEELPQLGERTMGFMQALFPLQLALINDPSKQKAAVCSRRAGKSTTMAYYLLKEAMETDHSTCLYVALTRASAKRIMWRELKRCIRRYKIDVEPNNTDLCLTFPNGSQIYVAGADNASDIDKFRGSAFKLVVIDEAGSFGHHLRELVDEVLEPALVDHNGTLVMVGTPTASCAGLFYEATTSPKSSYSVHKWTILQNPHIEHAAAWLNKRKAEKGWADNDPVYLREWCGIWVYDTDSIIYKYSEAKNTYDTLPQIERYGLGVDLGYEDPTAFTLWGWREHDPCLYLVAEHKESHMITSEIAQHIESYQKLYDIEYMVMDMGGMGRTVGEDLRRRHGLPIKIAEKSQKWAHIELMNDDLRRGLIKVPKNSKIAEEWRYLQKKEGKLIEDPKFANHLADAALYSHRHAKHYRYAPEPERIEHGSTRYYDMLEEEIWENETKLLRGPGIQWWEDVTGITIDI